MSVSTSGVQANAATSEGSISADGRFVAFWGEASNLVPGDTNGVADVFVRDRQAGTTERVSVATNGSQGNSDSYNSSISADGRFVVFTSFASNLVTGDTNATYDTFLHDRQSMTTERVSVATGGAQGNLHSWYPTISSDGRFVAFESYATNLVAGDTNGRLDIFVRDRQNLTTERVSVGTGGAQGNADSFDPSISSDGLSVAFESTASTLVSGDTNMRLDVFVRDRQSATTERVSVATSGAEGDADSGFFRFSLSANGRFVAFTSSATNLVAGDVNGMKDVFVRDRQSATTERVSVGTGSVQGDSDSEFPSLSENGRHVAFRSTSTNLIAGDTNGWSDVFVRDRQSATTELVSMSMGGGDASGASFAPSVSADGRFVAFHGFAANVVAGDTNGVDDVFVRDRGAPLPGFPFCFGDGSATACPCGNAGASGRGCGNSIDASGAVLAGSGTASISGDTLVLAGSGMPDAFALYIQGLSQHNGGLGSVFGDGLRCAGGAIIRLGTKLNVAGSSQYPSGTDVPVSVRGLVTSAGTRTYQVWYRNAAAFCTVSTFNLSNGLEVAWAL